MLPQSLMPLRSIGFLKLMEKEALLHIYADTKKGSELSKANHRLHHWVLKMEQIRPQEVMAALGI